MQTRFRRVELRARTSHDIHTNAFRMGTNRRPKFVITSCKYIGWVAGMHNRHARIKDPEKPLNDRRRKTQDPEPVGSLTFLCRAWRLHSFAHPARCGLLRITVPQTIRRQRWICAVHRSGSRWPVDQVVGMENAVRPLFRTKICQPIYNGLGFGLTAFTFEMVATQANSARSKTIFFAMRVRS